MLSENIKKFRLQKKMTQEDLALRINVVRQTLSKWEKGLSVPDADQLIELSTILGVTVNELLDLSEQDAIAHDEIAKELEKVNIQLAQLSKRYRLEKEANKVRGFIIFLVITGIIIASLSHSTILSVGVILGVSMVTLLILYKNIELLTVVTSAEADVKILKTVTVFNILLMLALALFVLLIEFNLISLRYQVENMIGIALLTSLMILSGIIAPKLPFNKHTGLRLPWTVNDEGTWNIAHRMIGLISLPIAIGYIVGAFFLADIASLSLLVIIVWIGLPAIISLIYYLQKFKGSGL